MTKKLRAILEEMENSDSFETVVVGDCLKTIAGNGGAQNRDMFLVGCAETIRDAAQSIINRMKEKKK